MPDSRDAERQFKTARNVRGRAARQAKKLSGEHIEAYDWAVNTHLPQILLPNHDEHQRESSVGPSTFEFERKSSVEARINTRKGKELATTIRTAKRTTESPPRDVKDSQRSKQGSVSISSSSISSAPSTLSASDKSSLDRKQGSTPAPSMGYRSIASSSGYSTPRASRCSTDTPFSEWSTHTPDGIELWPLSDTVPYLLGTKQYIDGLDALSSFRTALPVPKDAFGNEIFNSRVITARDRALLTIMTFLDQPVSTHVPKVQRWLEPFTATHNMLHCWHDCSPSPPTETAITLASLSKQFHIWQFSDSFFPLGSDNTLLISRWAHIIHAYLLPRSIQVDYITQSIFDELTATCPLNDDLETMLESKISTLEHKIESGLLPLPLRHQRTTKRRRRPNHVSFEAPAFEYIPPIKETSPNALYARRFSHANPLGALHSSVDTNASDKQRGKKIEQEADESTVRSTTQEIQASKGKKSFWKWWK